MKTVIEKYKKFVFVFVVINLFALVVNLFQIDFNIDLTKTSKVYLLTNNPYGNTSDKLWPLVSYIQRWEPQYNIDNTTFNGIFYQYGVAEFLLYMGILLGFLVYKAYLSPVKLKPQV